MTNKLWKYFPMLQSREQILEEIHHNEKLEKMFQRWEEKRQEEFLDFCTGVKGVKTLYDFCIKAVLDPEVYPERIEELISLLLEKKVKLLKVFPNDNTRISDETSLLIMDFLVQLSDKSVVNVEIQRVGYRFPGQRSACYSADLLLQEYRQVRKKTAKKAFSYQQISNVYTIVLFEKSTSEFHQYPNQYVHKFQQKSNTGMRLNLLQRYIFVALDIYKENHQNRGIRRKLDGWLTFLSSDDPEDIIALIEKYPEFKPMYGQIYEICQNIEQVMGMFSKELYELDRNTVQYMIDELQKENKRWKEKDKPWKEENKRWKEKDKRWREENKRWEERDRCREEENQSLKKKEQCQQEKIVCQQREIERLRKEMEEMKRKENFLWEQNIGTGQKQPTGA